MIEQKLACTLYETEFNKSILRGADFRNADGSCSQFRNGTDISAARFDDASLLRTVFDHVILTNAHFTRANLTDADFRSSVADVSIVSDAILC